MPIRDLTILFQIIDKASQVLNPILTKLEAYDGSEVEIGINLDPGQAAAQVSSLSHLWRVSRLQMISSQGPWIRPLELSKRKAKLQKRLGRRLKRVVRMQSMPLVFMASSRSPWTRLPIDLKIWLIK